MDKKELFERYFSFGFNPIRKDDLKYDAATDSTALQLEAVMSYSVPIDNKSALNVIIQNVTLAQDDDSRKRAYWSWNHEPFCAHLDDGGMRRDLTFTSRGYISPKIARESLEGAEIVVTLESKLPQESLVLTSSILFDAQSNTLIFGKPDRRIIEHANQAVRGAAC